jgi:hypothetical protein
MTELRRRMDEDMVVRGMADRTRETYLWAVEGVARYYGRPPDQLTDQEVQDYLRYLLRDRHRSWNTVHIVVHDAARWRGAGLFSASRRSKTLRANQSSDSCTGSPVWTCPGVPCAAKAGWNPAQSSCAWPRRSIPHDKGFFSAAERGGHASGRHRCVSPPHIQPARGFDDRLGWIRRAPLDVSRPPRSCVSVESTRTRRRSECCESKRQRICQC